MGLGIFVYQFYPGMWNIRACRIRCNLSPARGYDQIHIFHGNRTQQYLVSEYQCADVTKPVSEIHPDRPDIGEGTFLFRPSATETSRSDSVSSFSCKAKCSGIQSISEPVSASAAVLMGTRSGYLGLLSSICATT